MSEITMSEIYTVRELTERVKGLLEKGFPFVWVSGEVTNLSRPGSGHVYFSLRDGQDLLNCVWFRGRQRDREAFDPLTGEVFEDGPRPSLAKLMHDGDQIACAGALTVYGPRGAYQLVVELAQESGQGDLLRRLELLKRELAAKGWFDRQRKRELPDNPERVALITAPTGAAVRDFLRIANERGTGAEIRIHPVPVQGAEAAPRLAEAVRAANADGWAQVIVIIRGGGSLEDLWAFNDARLAEAIVQSGLPVLTGIGHEVDTSIADLAADKRAATPSHAAQILWRERQWHEQRLDGMLIALQRAMGQRLDRLDARLGHWRKGLAWQYPLRRLERNAERLGHLQIRLGNVMDQRLARSHARLGNLQHELRRVGPQTLLTTAEIRVQQLQRELTTTMARHLDNTAHALAHWNTRLEGMDPHAPLQRGYALIRTRTGLLRRIADAVPGDTVRLCLQDGEAAASITETFPTKISSPTPALKDPHDA